MKQFIKRVTMYGLVIFAILNCIAFLSLFSLSRSNFYKPQFVKNGVHDREFDYVVLGSSTGLTTLDTKLMDSLSGKKGLNISMDDSSLSSHFLMLQHFYELNMKTRRLILAITPWDVELAHPVLNDTDYRFLPHLNETCVREYYREVEHTRFNKLSLSTYFPILGVSYFNTELFYPSMIAAMQPNKRNRFDDKGNYSYPITDEMGSVPFKTINLTTQNPYLVKIKQFCKTHDIELVLYQSPIFMTKVVTTANQNVINHSDLLKDPHWFYDLIHVNTRGRKICSKEMASYLKNEN